MAATHTADETTPFTGYLCRYYPARLSDSDLNSLEVWARYCREGKSKASLLSAYLCCIASFESQRRQLIAEGNEVLEAVLPELPCHCWSNVELVAATTKLDALRHSTDGEFYRLFDKLFVIVMVEGLSRLDPTNEANI